ncbi:MAG TPA: L-threonylcarbamoyladenylate synthase [Candidatus Saccharimonadales bacterium]|nr:L-threonylcarbamoyladenylate synthase [Candidatus Saccharimonadales bacterium]
MSLDGAVKLIKDGQVGILPTDTVYGLVCSAANMESAAKLYNLKKRQQKPGTIVAANIDQLVNLGFKARYLKAVQHFWPGPISIVIPCVDLAYLHLGEGGVAVRIPSDKEFSKFLQKTGALLTTSANLPDQPTADNIKQAQRYFGKNVDFYIDGGDLSNREPSTVIRIVDDAVEILRQGAVKIDESGKILK